MKFGKSLRNQMEETLPEWRDKFLSYKELKKRLKLIDSAHGKRQRVSSGGFFDCLPLALADSRMSAEELDFIRLLEEELEKFNSFFVEMEEEYIIRIKELKDRVAKAKSKAKPRNDEMFRIKKEIVDFHGEMVLLENYSALNYTGLVKILKKYDKRTGALIRLPFIQNVLQQPFFTTDVLFKLVKECERMLELLSLKAEPTIDSEELCDSTRSSRVDELLVKCPKELGGDIENMESLYMKSTISALRALKEIRSGSSTVSIFSLPPLPVTGMEAAWKKIPVLEQVAK